MSARTKIDRLRTANPGAADLATLCSLAVLVEPELLRRLRLLLPGADVTAESDLWASDLLSGASSRGIALDPLAADELRADLRLPRWSDLRTVSWQHIADCHRTLHWSLRLEEQINRHVVGGAGAEAVEPLLLAAVGELITASRDRGSATQVGIARWLLGALARLPRLAAATDAASAASLAAGLHLDGRVPATSAPLGDHWLPWLLATVGASRIRVAVRFTDGLLEVNTSSPDSVPIELPRTQPLVLDVDWHDGRTPHSTRLTFTDAPATCPVHADDVTLTTLAGTRTRLSRTRTTPAGLDFTPQRTHHRPFLGRSALLGGAALVVEGTPWTLLSGSEGTGKTALACAVADRLERRGWVVVQHFYGVDPGWDDPEVVATSLESQLRAAFPDADWTRPVTGQPGGLWNAFERISDLPDHAHVLVLIDGVPGDSTDDTARWLYTPALSTDASRSTHFVLTGSYASGAEAWRRPPEPRESFDLDDGTYDVCAAILKYHNTSLRDVWDTEPSPSELISLAGDNPGRLTRILDWLLIQPAGTATLNRIPRSLTVHMKQIWRQLAVAFPRELVESWFAAVAVARERFTVDDALLLARVNTPTELLGAAVDFGLIDLDGPLDDGTTLITAEPSLAPVIEAEFGQNSLSRGHILHADAFPMQDVGRASPYQISSALHHFANADRTEMVGLPMNGEYLRRRACQDGVPALLDELRSLASVHNALIRHAAEPIADVAIRHPDRFVELLIAELHRQGRAVPTELVGDWPPALVPRWVRHPPGDPDRVRIDTEVTAATTGRGNQTWFALLGPGTLTVHDRNGSSLFEMAFYRTNAVTMHGTDIAVAAGTELTLISGTAPRELSRWRTNSPITTLASYQGKLVAGTHSGVILIIDQDRPPRHLVGHAAAITALAEIPERLISASLDGTVRTWNLTTNHLLHTRRHRGPVHHVATIPAGDVVSADDTGRVHWWNPDTGDEVRPLRGHDAPITALSILDYLTVLSAAADGTTRLWHRSDPALDRQLTHSGRTVIGVRRDEFTKRSFLTWTDRGVITYWDDAATEIATLHRADIQPPIRTIIAVDDLLLVHAGGVLSIPRRPTRTTPDLPTERPIAMLDPDTVVLGRPTGRLVHHIAGNEWRSDRGLTLPVSALTHVPQATAFATREADHLVGTALGEVMLIGEEHEPLVATVPAPVTAVAVSGFPWCVVGTADGMVYRWDPEGADLVTIGRHDGPVAGLAAAGKRFAVSTSADGTVRLWDVPNGAEHAIVAGPEPFHGSTFVGLERVYARAGEDGLWCLDLLATDTPRSGEGFAARGYPSGDIRMGGAPVPFEIRAVRPRRAGRFGTTGIRVSTDVRSRFAEQVGPDGRLAVPWRFPAERESRFGVESDPPLDGVRVAFVTVNNRGERWLEIPFTDEEQT